MRYIVRSVIGLVLSLAWSQMVMAQVPHLIRYQGQAVDTNGVPLEGPYTLTFRLYDAETAGTVVWQEPPQPNVPITKGYFSVLLGQVTALNANWSMPLWLSVQVNTDPELAPRQRITSVPLAVRAESAEQLTQTIPPTQLSPQGSGSSLDADTVDGKHASDLLNRANHTGTQAPSTISPQGTGSGLDADTVDGQHAAAFALVGHSHSLGYQIVTNSATSGGHFTVEVSCPAGKKVLGGGCNQQSGGDRALVHDNPLGDSGWHCRGRDVNTNQTVTLTAYAICANSNIQ